MSLLDEFLFSSPKAPNLDEMVVWPEKSWELACMIGMLRSDILHGYPDAFDGVDHADYANDLYMVGPGQRQVPTEKWTKRELLENYVLYDEDDKQLILALKDMEA